MDAKTRNKLVNALMTKFVKFYEQRYDTSPKINRYTEKWGFGDMFDDLGDESDAVLRYYFTLRRSHSTSDLLKNYPDIREWMHEDEQDEVARRALLEETRQRVKEYDDRWHQRH